MNLELTAEERDLLMSLIASRISELHPEIRRSMHYDYEEQLEHRLETLQALMERLDSLSKS